MKDFWLSCGHHLLDRDEAGALVVTDEFLKAYLARPELSPPSEACAGLVAVEQVMPAAEPKILHVPRLDQGLPSIYMVPRS